MGARMSALARKQTARVSGSMSEKCQKRTWAWRYSITLSARASNFGGSSIPVARAVRRLILR